MDWKDNLLKSMHNPKLMKYSDDKVVIIEDLYPKSECHFLIIPYEDIPDIISVRRHHLNIVCHMENAARNFASQQQRGKEFWLGYHAKPSMNRLHLHLISNDFNGSGLKNKKHWNSFTTQFFIASSQVINDLHQFGYVKLPSEAESEMLLKTPLKCHKCNTMPINIPTLKLHLLTHSPYDV